MFSLFVSYRVHPTFDNEYKTKTNIKGKTDSFINERKYVNNYAK